jgi:hypothetical protein
MCNTNSSGVWISLVSGGLAGAIVTLCTQRILEALRIWRLSKSILLETEVVANGCRIRVINRGVHTVEDAIAYISLSFDPQEDVLEGQAFIGPNNRIPLRNDRLCWSAAAPESNPFRISIYPGEKQALDLVRINGNQIEIPSEQGWGDMGTGKRSRVFLKQKRYEGTIYLVAKNVLRRSFSLVIDSHNKNNPVMLSSLNFVSFFDVLFRSQVADN